MSDWRRVSGVICDRRVPIRLKGKVHKSVVRPAMTYGLEAAPRKETGEKRLDVAEMKMLRWMSGVTLRDKVRKIHIRESVNMIDVSNKVQEALMIWFGHIMRREDEEHHVAKEVMSIEVEGTRRISRPKVRWRDCVENDMRERKGQIEEVRRTEIFRKDSSKTATPSRES